MDVNRKKQKQGKMRNDLMNVFSQHEPLTSWITLEYLNYLSLSFPLCKNGNRIDTVWLIRQLSEMYVELMISLLALEIHIMTTYRRHKGD